MTNEQEDKITKLLEDSLQQSEFVGKCAEFLEYIQADCAGISPGVPFFEHSRFGLRLLSRRMPRYRMLFGSAAIVFDTLIERVPGEMYPRGSDVFSDLSKIGDLIDGLHDAGEQLIGECG